MRIPAIILICLQALFASGNNTYSREEILKHAFTHSETLKEIEAEINKVESMRKEYNGKAFPQIEGTAGYQHSIQRVPMPIGFGDMSNISFTNSLTPGASADDQIIAGTLDGLIDGFVNSDLVMPKNSLIFQLALYQPIFAQGKVATGIKIAKIYEQTILQKYRNAQFIIAEQIIGDYNLALVAQQNITIKKESLELAKTSHDLAIKRFVAGKGSSLDTLNTHLGVQKEIFTLRDAKKNHRLALKKLFTTAAISAPARGALLTDTLSVPKFHLSYVQAEELMMEHNSTIILLNLAEKLQKKMTTFSKTDFLPMLVGGASMAKVSQYNGSEDFAWYNDTKLFASLTVPLFSGGQRFQKVKQARYEEDKIREKKSGAIRQMHLALVASYEEYEVALAELKQTEELIKLSKEGFRISTLSYEVGQITQFDLSTSQQQYNLTQLAYYNALYTVQVAVTKIERLIGEQSLLAEAPSLENSND